MKLLRDLGNLLAMMIAVLIAMTVSMAADLSHAELGALANLIYPPAFGGLCVIIYLVAVYLFRWNAAGVTLACCIAIILLGVKLYYTT